MPLVVSPLNGKITQAKTDGACLVLYRILMHSNIIIFFSVPVAIVVILFYAEILDCLSLPAPYLVCIYISMANRY